MARLVVVSNRVSISEASGEASVGGLTMALSDALKDCDGVWFGWSGQTSAEPRSHPDIRRTGGVTVATIDLIDQDVAEYYNGYANTVLWPLFHHRIDLTQFERTFDQGYERVNARFADALLTMLAPDDVIWVHDYHLIPLGAELRRRGVGNRIGFFLHVPWPAREIMTALPQHRDLVRSLFAYDLVGFQCQAWLDAFIDYVTGEVQGRIVEDRITAFGQGARVGVFPIGIDAAAFETMRRTQTADQSYLVAAASSAFRTMVISVDRVDYAKGVEERFLAFERLLERRPDLKQQVSLLQIGQPSRATVAAYAHIADRIDALSGRINGKYATVDWSPIRYMNQSFGRAHIAGLYRAARVGLVTPLRDGMNLVAKEYVAAQDPTDPGVLILSRFAGAASQLSEALIVNPYSRDDVVDALTRALAMPKDERISRWRALMESIKAQDASWWKDAFLSELNRKSVMPPTSTALAPVAA